VRSVLEWAQARAMAVDGVSQREIARRLGINRRTVRRMLEAGEPPRYRRSPPGSKLDPFGALRLARRSRARVRLRQAALGGGAPRGRRDPLELSLPSSARPLRLHATACTRAGASPLQSVSSRSATRSGRCPRGPSTMPTRASRGCHSTVTSAAPGRTFTWSPAGGRYWSCPSKTGVRPRATVRSHRWPRARLRRSGRR
jgi:hypothetical protein